MIEWTKPLLRRFKDAVHEATTSGKESLVFDGHEFLVSYAKYLIEYLEMKL